MAEDFKFDIDGLEELQRDLEKAIRKAPAQAEETLLSIAKDFKASAKKRADTTLHHTKRTGDGKKKAIGKKWGHKLVDDSMGMAVMVWNSAPHFHLVENGHNLVRGGHVVGFVQGKRIMEKTRNEYQNIVPERFMEMLDDILQGSGLN
ncbi:MAG: HK97 gp10 family phage protein [Eubacterium sp.]|jgi:hypothetical protein|nr:HK97 gp10 family phage protein [Eubacterium sp.]